MFNEADIEKMFIERATQNGWRYVPSDQIPRSMDSVLVDSWLQEALLRLNPNLTEEQIGQVIHKLRAAIIGVQPHDLVAANELFRDLLFEKNTYPFGEDSVHIPVRFFAETEKELHLNDYVITNQWCYPKGSGEGGKRLDIVMLVNGIPLIIGELKTPVRASVSWADGAQDIQSYEQSIPQMFVPNVLNFASEGKTFRYASIGAPLTKWGPWFEDENHEEGTLELATKSFTDMLQPKRIIDFIRYFTLYATDRKFRKIKIICRYQQYEGANAIVKRVLTGYPKQGLIWHFQGSGKSLLMVCAAQKLRMQKELRSPTVVIVDDRIDLETQITADFMSADIPNL
ncbi:MAG: type I restriction endonuclease subunit R, partial [Verrucomicrobia bacterium]|nr:type I restriction endonuclease subunit R [Verrucomicrobiota bacterium]